MVNHLKEVIVRVDLPIEFEFANTDLPKDLQKAIIALFPIPEPQEIKGFELQLSNTEKERQFIQKEASKKEWNFYDKDKTKRLVISDKTLFITYKAYVDFPSLKSDWLPVLKKIFEMYPELQINRLGLRYINEIPLKGKKEEWKSTINEKLLQPFYLGVNNIARSFNVVDYTEEDLRLRFQYGIPNKDFPAVIKAPIFILDYDAFYEGLLDHKTIKKSLEKFHTKIKEIHKVACLENE